MRKITLKLKESNNPFYGLDNCLDLFECGTGDNITTEKLDKCWEEVHASKAKLSKTKLEMYVGTDSKISVLNW